MNTEEAFKHFLTDIAPGKVNQGTLGSWMNRFSKGKMTSDKVREILLEHGYILKEDRQIWVHQDMGDSYTMIYLTSDGVFSMTVIANKQAEAFEMMESKAGFQRGFDSSGMSVKDIVKKINDFLLHNL